MHIFKHGNTAMGSVTRGEGGKNGETRTGAAWRYREIARRIAGRVENPNISRAVAICAN